MYGGTVRREPGASTVLVVILGSYLMIGVDMSIVNIALPAIRVELGFSAVALSWVLNAYMLAFGGLLFLGGRLGDLIGRRRTLHVGIVLFTLASGLGGFAPAGWWLLGARALQGVGAALIAPSTMALLTASFPEGEQRNRALGAYTTAASFGVVIGLLLGGLLTGLLTWRWVFYVNVPIGIALAVLVPRVLRETATRSGSLDLPGAIASTVGMSLLVYALINASSRGFASASTLGSLGASLGLLAFFAHHERRTAEPLLPLSLFANRNRVAAYLALLLIVAGNFGMFFFATQFLQNILGFDPIETGLAYLPMALTLMVMARIVPRLLRTLSARSLVLVGTPLQAAAMLWLSRLQGQSTYLGGIVGPMVLIGVAMGLCTIPLTALSLSAVAPKDSGAASGLTQTMRSIGGTFGLAVLVSVFGLVTSQKPVAGTSDIASLLVLGATKSFFVAAAFALLAFLATLVFIRRSTQGDATTDAESHKSVVRRYFEMITTGETSGAHEILHSRSLDHAHGNSSGIAGVIEAIAREHQVTDGLRIVIDRMISEGDHVAVHTTLRGRTGNLGTAKRAMWFLRMEEKKIVEIWTAHEPVRRALIAE